MKTSYTITTPEEFKKMSPQGNGISIYATNSRDLYYRLEALANCCLKKFKKFNGLDMEYLTDSSIMKSISRDARKQLRSSKFMTLSGSDFCVFNEIDGTEDIFTDEEMMDERYTNIGKAIILDAFFCEC